MAYFDCIVGGASGDGVSLIVECDSNFAGSTITADNGEDVFSEICPSVSPYTVKFEGIPIGTYTISGVSQGQTFTTQFTVLDYQTTLNAIPNGATVTPVNNIQIWLHCANIWDKNYTTINEVLADASTLQALIASNNAADYMARSTSWASSVTANANAMTYIGANNYCANKLLSNSTWSTAISNSAYFESVLNVKVPTMTSNTAPYGEAIASSAGTSAPAYMAFDGNDTTYHRTPGNNEAVADYYLGYKATSQLNAKRVIVRGTSYSASYYYDIAIYGGDNLNSLTKISNTQRVQSDFNNVQELTFVLATNLNAYLYHVVKIESSNASSTNGANWALSINTLQFYGRA